MIKIGDTPIKKILSKKTVDIDKVIDGIGSGIEVKMSSEPTRNFHKVVSNSELTEAVKAKFLPKGSK